MTPRIRSEATVLLALVVATACAKSDPDVDPTPAVAVADAAPGTSVCAPKGYITENIETTYADLFTANDAKSVSRRKGMKIERLKLARISTVDDERTCARAVHALAAREPAAAAALGARSSRARAAKATDPSTRPVKPAAGGVLAIVRVGPYYVVQDATPRPNQTGGAKTYVLDGSMKVRGVFQ